jgi:hypothetical protein
VSRAAETTRRIVAGVDAALARDAAAFGGAVAGLATVDLEIVGTVEAAVIRDLLEELHPAGLTGDDVRSALERTTRANLDWWPDVAVEDLIAVYTAALGMNDPEAPTGDRGALARHGLLVIADLCSTAAEREPAAAELLQARAVDVLRSRLSAALAEIHRAQTVEMP